MEVSECFMGFDGCIIWAGGAGALIEGPGGEVLAEISKPLGLVTNNEAEYLALIYLLEQAIKLNIKSMRIQGDSQLVVNQVNGSWRVKQAHLFRLYGRVRELLEQIPKWSLVWVPRELNEAANKLSQKAAVGFV